MDKKQFVIDYLLNTNNWETVQSISTSLSIPRRSLQRYVSIINHEYPNLIYSSTKGYKLNKRLYKKNVDTDAFNKEGSIVNAIIKQIILSEEQKDIYQLSEELYVSVSSLKQAILKVKDYLIPFGLNCIVKNNLLSFVGTEKDKRKVIRDLVYDEAGHGFINLRDIEDFFPNYDGEKIKGAITEVLNHNKLYIDDYALYDLVLHIVVKIDRTRAEHELIQKQDTNSIPEDLFQQVAKEICDSIQGDIPVRFSSTEISEFGVLISARAKLDKEAYVKRDLKAIATEEAYQIAEMLLCELNDYYSIDLREEIFLFNFSVHIKNMIARIKNGIQINNPLTSNLKSSYPFIYELSIFLAEKFMCKTGMELNEDEIAYITLHLGSQLEEKESFRTKVVCILICPEFYDINRNLFNELNKRYHDSMIISKVLSSFDDLDYFYQNCDLVLSTLPIDPKFADKSQRINMLMTPKSYQTLSEQINFVTKRKSSSQLIQNINNLFNKKLFFICDEKQPYQKILRQLSSALEKNGYVDSTFYSACMSREAISPTAYNELAIPHPTELQAKKSVIAVAINKKYFEWNENRVKLVLLLAINKEKIDQYKSIFDLVCNYLDENKDLKPIIDVEDFSQFQEKILDFIVN